jgi:hypothetical protein
MRWCVPQRLLEHPLTGCLLRPLTFAVQAFAVSSAASAVDTFRDITTHPTFRTGSRLDPDFYVFVFEFSGRCVAHGAHSDFVGMTLSDIMGVLDMPDTILQGATSTHQQFMAAAEAGGGWVEYEWASPGEPDRPPFQKMAYIFSLHLDGIKYYGGAHQAAVHSPAFGFLALLSDKLCCREISSPSERVVLQVLGIPMFRMVWYHTWRRAKAKVEGQ